MWKFACKFKKWNAHFEREVSAERVRDKIAASKAKGLWMGGTPPIGYDANERI